MVETTLDFRFSADDDASVVVGTTAVGEYAKQAELLCLAEYAARILTGLTVEEAERLARSLSTLEDAPADADRAAGVDGSVRVAARFLNSRRGPRSFFRVTLAGPSAPERTAPPLPLVVSALVEHHEADTEQRRRLATTAALVARLAAAGRLESGNEFAAALVSASYAWRRTSDTPPTNEEGEWRCPACANFGPFEFMLWPSETASLRRCDVCGNGVWVRARRRPRLIPQRSWSVVDALHSALANGVEFARASDRRLLEGLMRGFVENGWPFAEVQGAQVLVSELSGPRGSWKFYAQAIPQHELVLLYSICPVRVPPDRRSEAADFITRVNFGLAAGNFELDFKDGELRCKTSFHVHEDTVDSAVLKRAVRANGLAMEAYLDEIEALAKGTSETPL